MPKDAILRCSGIFLKDGRKEARIVHALDEGGEYYILVLKWQRIEVKGMERTYPLTRISVHKSRVEVQSGNPDFELRLCDPIDLDKPETKDVEFPLEDFKPDSEAR